MNCIRYDEYKAQTIFSLLWPKYSHFPTSFNILNRCSRGTTEYKKYKLIMTIAIHIFGILYTKYTFEKLHPHFNVHIITSIFFKGKTYRVCEQASTDKNFIYQNISIIILYVQCMYNPFHFILCVSWLICLLEVRSKL